MMEFVIASASEAIQELAVAERPDCFVAKPVIGPRDFARVRWLLAMTGRSQEERPLTWINAALCITRSCRRRVLEIGLRPAPRSGRGERRITCRKTWSFTGVEKKAGACGQISVQNFSLL